METLEELIEHTEWLLDQVETVQQTLERLTTELQACGDGLRGKLDDLRAKTDLVVVVADTVTAGPEVVKKKANASGGGSGAFSERRASPRRKGNPISVRVSKPRFEGWIVDRSQDGFSLLANLEVAVGTSLSVCPAQQSANPRWFQAEVRSCHAKGKNWVLGCQFTGKLSWKDWRLFG